VAFLLVVLALHDAVWMPLILAVGAAVRAAVPGRARAFVQGVLIVTVSVAFVAWPLVLGRGRIADNPSALPRDYRAGLVVTVAATWLGAAIIAALQPKGRTRGSRHIRPSRHRDADTGDAGSIREAAQPGERRRRTAIGVWARPAGSRRDTHPLRSDAGVEDVVGGAAGTGDGDSGIVDSDALPE
jgi:hypothetical protein